MGKGSSGKVNGAGKAVNGFLNSMRNRDAGGMMNALRNAPMTVNKAVFTKNGNAVNHQEARIKSGETEISLRFINGWEPTAQTPPERPISIRIEAVVYKNGNAQAIRTLSEKKTKSLKNAAKNYQAVEDEWKRLTRQKKFVLD